MTVALPPVESDLRASPLPPDLDDALAPTERRPLRPHLALLALALLVLEALWRRRGA